MAGIKQIPLAELSHAVAQGIRGPACKYLVEVPGLLFTKTDLLGPKIAGKKGALQMRQMVCSFSDDWHVTATLGADTRVYRRFYIFRGKGCFTSWSKRENLLYLRTAAFPRFLHHFVREFLGVGMAERARIGTIRFVFSPRFKVSKVAQVQ